MDAQLNRRFGALSTEELINIVTVEALSYSPDARRIAVDILTDRGVDTLALPSPSLIAVRPTERPLFDGMDNSDYAGEEKSTSPTLIVLLVLLVVFVIFMVLFASGYLKDFHLEDYLG